MDHNLSELLKTQKSLTEWLEDINHKDARSIRREDNDKRERLRVLNEVIGLPFDKPVQFKATDLSGQTSRLTRYLAEHGDEPCALRLIPIKEGLPKLRMRGKTVAKAYEWFNQQDLDPASYRADFVPYPPDYSWATIFIVNSSGIQGEIIYGGHHLLTQGFHAGSPPIVFRYDFSDWKLQPRNDEALAHLKILAKHLHVPDKAVQRRLHAELGATFTHDYLDGYFESADSSAGTWFIDYNQSLGKLYAEMTLRTEAASGSALVSGQTGCGGQAGGLARIVPADHLHDDFPEGAILVCAVTTPDYVPLMQKAAAIVTDQGGILSHAAIVARELKKPCIVATGNATQVLQDRRHIMVDADAGTVTGL